MVRSYTALADEIITVCHAATWWSIRTVIVFQRGVQGTVSCPQPESVLGGTTAGLSDALYGWVFLQDLMLQCLVSFAWAGYCCLGPYSPMEYICVSLYSRFCKCLLRFELTSAWRFSQAKKIISVTLKRRQFGRKLGPSTHLSKKNCDDFAHYCSIIATALGHLFMQNCANECSCVFLLGWILYTVFLFWIFDLVLVLLMCVFFWKMRLQTWLSCYEWFIACRQVKAWWSKYYLQTRCLQ